MVMNIIEWESSYIVDSNHGSASINGEIASLDILQSITLVQHLLQFERVNFQILKSISFPLQQLKPVNRSAGQRIKE